MYFPGDILGVVDVEEIRVQQRLQNPRDDGHRMKPPFRKVSVDPIWDVQGSVQTQRKEVVRRDGLRFAGTLEHEQLRQDGDRFEPDGE